MKKNVARITGPSFRLSTIAQKSQQSALRWRVLAFYSIAPCLRMSLNTMFITAAYWEFSYDITEIKIKKRLILLRFYFHDL